MKNKGLLIIFIILFLLSSASAGIGYYEHTKSKPEKPNIGNTTEAKITYKYYLEDEEVQEMPGAEKILDELGNETDKYKYKFSLVRCVDATVSGQFNEEEWKFVPNVEKDTTCNLFFVNSTYEVTLTVTNGKADDNNPKYIEREKDGEFKIIPSEGYKFSEVQCSDEKSATWNEQNNTLTINAIMKNVACKVVFTVKELKMDVTVVNGKGNTTETAKYGESVSAIVEPNEGFQKGELSCTNDQVADFKDNKITISKLTDNTKCTLTFIEKPVKKYSIKITTLPDTISIIKGSKENTVEEGKTGEFMLKGTSDNIKPSIKCSVEPSKAEDTTEGYKYTFLNVTKDITCEVTAVAE